MAFTLSSLGLVILVTGPTHQKILDLWVTTNLLIPHLCLKVVPKGSRVAYTFWSLVLWVLGPIQ